MILYFHDVPGVCFVIRDEPYGVIPTLTVGPTSRLISILIYSVQHWPVIEQTLAQRLVFILKWLHRPIPQPQTHEAFGPSFRFINISATCPHPQLTVSTVIKKLWTMFGIWGRDHSRSPPCLNLFG